MMVNPTNPRLTPSVTLTPETGWHFTWEARPLYDQAAVDAAVAAERERIGVALRAMDSDAELHNYYGHAAWVLFERPNVGAKLETTA
jgi:hypothetical protein